MIIRAGLLILATVAALAVSSNGFVKPSRKQKPGPESSGDEDVNRRSRHVKEKEETKTADANQRRVIARQDKGPNGGDEVDQMRHLLNDLRRREVAVKKKLLELYGLREQHSFIEHLKRQLRVRSSEINTLKAAVTSLKAEKNNLEKEFKESLVATKQLEMAEEMMKRCQEKMAAGGTQMQAQLNRIEEQVYGFHSKEKLPTEPKFGRKMKTMDDVKLEVLEMNRRNKELGLENRELALRLNSARVKTASLSTMTEGEAIARAKEEASTLKHANEYLLKQIETLQKQRFDMLEELVYQKWLHSCLRFEIQDHQTPLRDPRNDDPSKDQSFGSRQEAKSIGRVASDSTDSSQTSMESREIEDTSSTLESSSSSRSSISKKRYLITKIKKWNKSKRESIVVPSPERPPSKSFLGTTGLIRRFSTSTVPEGLFRSRTTKSYWNFGIDASRKMSKKNPAESPSPEIRSRLRRVSFNDCVSVRDLEPESENVSTLDEIEPYSLEKYDGTLSRMSTSEFQDSAITVTAKEKVRKHRHLTASEATDPSHRSADELEQKEANERVVARIGPARPSEARYGQTNQIEARFPGLVSAIIFIIILLLVSRFLLLAISTIHSALN